MIATACGANERPFESATGKQRCSGGSSKFGDSSGKFFPSRTSRQTPWQFLGFGRVQSQSWFRGLHSDLRPSMVVEGCAGDTRILFSSTPSLLAFRSTKNSCITSFGVVCN